MKSSRWIHALGALIGLAAWSASALGAVPDPTKSYFVPQSGLDYSNPQEGNAAVGFFHVCPNNDGGSSLPFNARLKVVVRDANDAPIAGIAAADIFIDFNGGTAAQGFSGSGADSVIANSAFNSAPLCPDVRHIPADGPTDASGVAYITFTGPGGVRDPNRKWGHYDTFLPVKVVGIPLSGRLTSDAVNGSYLLRIKNFDWTGGLGTTMNLGEAVTTADYNGVKNALGVDNSISYWKDFDSDGVVSQTDLNMVICHMNHDCDTPNNP